MSLLSWTVSVPLFVVLVNLVQFCFPARWIQNSNRVRFGFCGSLFKTVQDQQKTLSKQLGNGWVRNCSFGCPCGESLSDGLGATELKCENFQEGCRYRLRASLLFLWFQGRQTSSRRGFGTPKTRFQLTAKPKQQSVHSSSSCSQPYELLNWNSWIFLFNIVQNCSFWGYRGSKWLEMRGLEVSERFLEPGKRFYVSFRTNLKINKKWSEIFSSFFATLKKNVPLSDRFCSVVEKCDL